MVEIIPTKEELRKALEIRQGVEFTARLSAASVAICGLGGLGSNVAIALARAGIGRLHLVDFDKVDITNLHRQQYTVAQLGMYKTAALQQHLSQISPYLEVDTDNIPITCHNLTELLQREDIICEALDNAESKAMLVNGVLEHFPEKYIVAASGMAGMFPANSIQTRKISSHFFLCGDGINEVTADTSLVSSRVMLCAAHQAHMILRIIAGETEA